MTRIRYTTGTPEEVVATIEPLFAKWLQLVPTWCHEIAVVWDDQDTEGALSVEAHYDYRRATINVLPNFLSSPECRERDVVHELMHLSLAPVMQATEALRDALVKEVPSVETWANEMIRQGEEASTCDLVRLVLERQ